MTNAETLGVAPGEPPLTVGGLAISGRAFLAPMAGVTDAAMRRIAERHGAGATFSEMITAAGVSRGDRETRLRLAGARERQTAPRVVQIAARDPEGIALAARHAADIGRGVDRHQHGLSVQKGHRRACRLRLDARSGPGQPTDRRDR